jgi:hypothetical protein
MLNDLLADFVKSDAKWPLAVSNQRQEVIAFLFPRPGLPGKSPPKLSPEREAEVNSRLRNLEDSRDLRDYIATLDSSGGSS